MSANDLDRRLASFFDAASSEALPGGLLDDVYAVTRQLPQRKGPAARRTAALATWWANPFGVAPRLRILAVAVLLILALVATLTYVAGHWRRLPPPFGPAGNGLIVFDLDQRLYVAQPDGTAIPLDIGLGHSWDPTFSPDGTHLAFWSQAVPGQPPVTLFVADADGSHAHSVTGDMPVVAFKLATIAWSPDGRQIAFASSANGKRSALYVAVADGSGVVRITPDDDYERAYPAWSPSGDRIAFQRSIDGDVELALIAPDGSGETRLQRDDGFFEGAFAAVWSPDGTRLAYARTIDGIGRVGVMGLDTPEVLMPDLGAGAPVWSNDGTRIAYNIDGGAVIVANLATGARVEIPPELGYYFVVWSPDDRMLLGAGLCPKQQGCNTMANRIPLDDPSAATAISDGGGDLRLFSWQRVAP